MHGAGRKTRICLRSRVTRLSPQRIQNERKMPWKQEVLTARPQDTGRTRSTHPPPPCRQRRVEAEAKTAVPFTGAPQN